jgi:phosphoenolpyruvate phosphomutase
MEEFCGRIRAGKDSQVDDDFVIVARTEALISGWSMDEALIRAEAYHAAGADAVLIHSKKPAADEIFEFRRRWGDRAPVVIVPTTYHATPTDLFRQAGVSTMIWANHLLRASITAMRETAARIAEDQSLHNVEGRVAGVKDIFRLTGNDELEAAEARYLPTANARRAVVIAATPGDLGELTRDRPKCMMDIRGRSLLQRLVSNLAESGVRETTVIRGFGKETVSAWGAKFVDNDRYSETGEVYSLGLAGGALHGELVVAYGDVLFRQYVLDRLQAVDADIVLAVDARGPQAVQSGSSDLVIADRRFSGDTLDDVPAHLVSMRSASAPTPDTAGEWMGLARTSPLGAQWVLEAMEALKSDGLYETADLPMLFSRIAEHHPVRIQYFTGDWMDVDTLSDLADARNFS